MSTSSKCHVKSLRIQTWQGTGYAHQLDSVCTQAPGTIHSHHMPYFEYFGPNAWNQKIPCDLVIQDRILSFPTLLSSHSYSLSACPYPHTHGSQQHFLNFHHLRSLTTIFAVSIYYMNFYLIFPFHFYLA